MTETVIVSATRTGLAKNWKGAFNVTRGATLGGHTAQHATKRVKIEPSEVESILIGCMSPEGATGANVARQIALRAGCPVTVPSATVSRFCSSGPQTIVTATQRVITGEDDIFVAGGVKFISCVQQEMNRHMMAEDQLDKHKPEAYWNIFQTAENVAKRYNIAKERMGEYNVQNQQHAATVTAAGKLNNKIVPTTTVMGVTNARTGQLTTRKVTISTDEGIRTGITLEGVSRIHTAIPGGVITAGNASQFFDGASAAVVMSGKVTAAGGLQPLGVFCDFAVAGCRPDEMGIGPVFAVPKLLERVGLRIEDIDLWELNEAFAAQVLYCVDKLGIPMDRLDVNGDAIAVGHPYGVSGTRLVGHALIEGKRRDIKYAVVTVCIGDGQDAASLFGVL